MLEIKLFCNRFSHPEIEMGITDLGDGLLRAECIQCMTIIKLKIKDTGEDLEVE